jgi:hypothetical protein
MDEIIGKALEKDRKLRYQSAAEIRTDLQRLKRDSDSGRSAVAADQVRSHKSIRWITSTLATILIVGLVMGRWLLSSRKADALTDKDTIVLADFTNATGDPVFDGTLRQGLSVQLEQSPFLSLISDERARQTLRLMGQSPDARLTPDLARQVCERTGSAALLGGSIASLGTQYVVGLKAVSCRNGDSLAEEQITADGKEHVLKALADAATRVRTKLGESLNTVEKFNTPLEQVTTPSLEALQAYSAGRRMIDKQDYVAAGPFFQRAIQLDPQFAMAYASLGVACESCSEKESEEYYRKSYELRERVSERERFYIDARYYGQVTGDLEKSRKVYELWAQTYPRDLIAHGNLSAIYGQLGRFDKALAEGTESLRLQPSSCQVYALLVAFYFHLNRLKESEAMGEEAQAKNFDCSLLRFNLYELAFLKNDVAGMARQADLAAGNPAAEGWLLGEEANTAAYSGKLREAGEIAHRAIAAAERAENKELAAWHEARAATREALFGNPQTARQRAAAALALSRSRETECGVALALTFSGDTDRVRRLADDLGRRFPEDTIVQFTCLPMLHAQLALNRNNAPEAIEALQSARLYEMGNSSFALILYPAYVRGQAYLANHQFSDAVMEFHKILDEPGVVLNSPIGALAHLQIGRAYAMQGDAAKAKGAYQDFLTLWKDADLDIPILKQAKAEYAKLQ